MGPLRIILQIVGVVILIPAVTIVTLRTANQGADGPSILFPGGKLVSGELHTGPEPDWSFTDEVPTLIVDDLLETCGMESLLSIRLTRQIGRAGNLEVWL